MNSVYGVEVVGVSGGAREMCISQLNNSKMAAHFVFT